MGLDSTFLTILGLVTSSWAITFNYETFAFNFCRVSPWVKRESYSQWLKASIVVANGDPKDYFPLTIASGEEEEKKSGRGTKAREVKKG